MFNFDIQKEVTGVIYVDNEELYYMFGVVDGEDMIIDYKTIPFLQDYVDNYIETYELDKHEVNNIEFMMNMVSELTTKCNKVQVRFKEM